MVVQDNKWDALFQSVAAMLEQMVHILSPWTMSISRTLFLHRGRNRGTSPPPTHTTLLARGTSILGKISKACMQKNKIYRFVMTLLDGRCAWSSCALDPPSHSFSQYACMCMLPACMHVGLHMYMYTWLKFNKCHADQSQQ